MPLVDDAREAMNGNDAVLAPCTMAPDESWLAAPKPIAMGAAVSTRSSFKEHEGARFFYSRL